MEQRITINNKRRVWFSGYRFGSINGKYEKARSKNFKVGKTAADRLLATLTAYFGDECSEIFATDIGEWRMGLTNMEGVTYKFRGSLCVGFVYEDVDLSDLVRDTVGMDDLYVFDGNHKPEYIFCSVTFGEGDKSYYYLADDNSIKIGDSMIVPVGKDNYEAVVEVVNVECFGKENVPFSVEKTKRIIRKCAEKDCD